MDRSNARAKEAGEVPVGRSGRPSLSSIYEEMRRRICLLIYSPGMILKESDLAAEFSVSRTPIREVLHQLKFEGLIQTRNGVGTFVTGVDFKSFIDTYDLRIELADLIGRLSPRPCDDSHVRIVEGLSERVKHLGKTHDSVEFWSINHEMHVLINGLIGNDELARLHSLYYYKVARFWYQLAIDNLEREVEMLSLELAELLTAMKSGDIKAVSYIHRNHISFAKIRIGQFIARGRR